MVLNNISGIGQVQEALTETNRLLAEVLAELRRTNDDKLTRVADLLDQQG